MHDSPQYALLQTLSRIHAECQQRLAGLENYLVPNQAPIPAQERISAVIQKTKQLFAHAEAGAIFDTCPIRNFQRNERRNVEMSWQWLTSGLESLSKSFSTGDFSTAKIDAFITELNEHL